MAKVKITGIGDAKPTKPLPPLTAGQYEVSIETAPDVDERDDGVNWKLRFNAVDGPEQPEYDENGQPTGDTVPPDGRTIFENVFVMKPNHPKFQQYGHIGLGNFKALLLAFDVEPDEEDTVDPEDFVGQQGSIKLSVRKPGKKDQRDEPYNEVRKYIPKE